jgi:hypothetical protein
MNIPELLNSINESTYDMKKIEEYYNHIISKLNPNDVAVDLTKSFHERFPEITKSSMLILKLKPIEVFGKKPTQEFNKAVDWGKTSIYNRRTEHGTRTPTAVLSIYVDKGRKINFKNTFLHEFVHVLDGLRTYSKKRHVPGIKSPSASEDFYKYRTSTFEFNQAINMIKRYKDGAYSKIKNVDDLVKWFIQRASGATVKSGLSNKIIEGALQDVSFRKHLLSRLARENLLPKGLQY